MWVGLMRAKPKMAMPPMMARMKKTPGMPYPLSQGSGDGVVAMISYLMCPDRAASLSCPTIPRLMPTAGPA